MRPRRRAAERRAGPTGGRGVTATTTFLFVDQAGATERRTSLVDPTAVHQEVHALGVHEPASRRLDVRAGLHAGEPLVNPDGVRDRRHPARGEGALSAGARPQVHVGPLARGEVAALLLAVTGREPAASTTSAVLALGGIAGRGLVAIGAGRSP